MPTISNNDILIYATFKTDGSLFNPSTPPFFVSLSKVDSTGTATPLSANFSGLISQIDGVKGVYKVNLTDSIFNQPGYRFVGLIDCSPDAAPQYQAFDYRPEDFVDAVGNFSSNLSAVSSNLTSVSSKIDLISSNVTNITSVKYLIQAKKVSTGEIVSWVSTDQGSQKPTATYSDALTDFSIKGSFI